MNEKRDKLSLMLNYFDAKSSLEDMIQRRFAITEKNKYCY